MNLECLVATQQPQQAWQGQTKEFVVRTYEDHEYLYLRHTTDPYIHRSTTTYLNLTALPEGRLMCHALITSCIFTSF